MLRSCEAWSNKERPEKSNMRLMELKMGELGHILGPSVPTASSDRLLTK